jgi:hypothetical protein
MAASALTQKRLHPNQQQKEQQQGQGLQAAQGLTLLVTILS